MIRFLPRFDTCRWGGPDLDETHDVTGWAIAFQWGPIFLEFCFGRRA